MKKTLLFTCLLCTALILSACASTPSASEFGRGSGSGAGSGTTGLAGIFSIFSPRRSFTLTPAEKLAIGTIRLDANGQAIDRAQAAKLLPLWQLMHQLYASSSAAPQEEAAVVDQIRSTMTPSQVSALDGMQLSRADIFAALQSGQANTSTGSGGNAGNGTSRSGGFTGGNGSRGNGGQGVVFFGGGPGGGAGGGFGAGGFRNGTGAGGSSSTTSTQQNITSAQRQAAASNGITSALINQVISLLQDKLSS